MMWLIILLVVSVGINAYFFLKDRSSGEKEESKPSSPISKAPPVISSATPQQVGEFYNQQTDNFLKVYGEVIQAFRTTDITRLLDYQIESIGFEKDWKVLDAGCGVCGPARYFALKSEINIDAVTISQDQVRKSKEYIERDGLQDKVRVHMGDYHQLHRQFDENSYDAVYFLESFGHAKDHKQVIESAWEVLKPGGTLYIKDLFLKEGAYPGHDDAIRVEANNINKAYHYNIANLYKVLEHIRKKGYILSQLKTIDLKLEEFENLTISNEFQELTGINKIEDLKSYIFPVDFFEVKCFKPWNDIMTGNSRYFLQNLYYMQVEGKKEEEL